MYLASVIPTAKHFPLRTSEKSIFDTFGTILRYCIYLFEPKGSHVISDQQSSFAKNSYFSDALASQIVACMVIFPTGAFFSSVRTNEHVLVPSSVVCDHHLKCGGASFNA